MVQKIVEEKLDDVMGRYKNMREALTGLHDIIDMNFPEKSIYHQAALDNLKALNAEIIEIMKTSFTPREVRMRLRDVKYDEAEMEQVFPF